MSIKIRIARKEHICCCCWKSIEIGEKHEEHKSIIWDSDGDYFSSMRGRRCVFCSEKEIKPHLTEDYYNIYI